MTGSTSGTDRNRTESRSPSQSPSTCRASRPLARRVNSATSCTRSNRRSRSGDCDEQRATNVAQSRAARPHRLRGAKMSRPVSNDASGLGWTARSPEVRPRGGVGDQREVHAADRRPRPGRSQRQRRVPAGGGEVAARARPGRTARARSARRPGGGVSIRCTTSASKPNPALKVKYRSSASPSPIRRRTAGAQRLQDGAGRVERVRGQPDSARTKTLVEPPGTTARAGTSGSRAVGEQPVDHLVDGAVAAERDDHVDAVAGRADGQRGGVPTVAGLLHLDLQLAGQRALEHLPAARRRGGGRGVDDQQRAHASA